VADHWCDGTYALPPFVLGGSPGTDMTASDDSERRIYAAGG
jgi:hypothetical protein